MKDKKAAEMRKVGALEPRHGGAENGVLRLLDPPSLKRSGRIEDEFE